MSARRKPADEPLIEAGTRGESRVFIGCPLSHYDEVVKPKRRGILHILHFSVTEAEAVVKMLQTEIRRVKRSQLRGAAKAAKG